jgi:hypothetical protein
MKNKVGKDFWFDLICVCVSSGENCSVLPSNFGENELLADHWSISNSLTDESKIIKISQLFSLKSQKSENFNDFTDFLE